MTTSDYVDINRDKAGELGTDMADIATTLSVMLREGYSSRFSYKRESYKVNPEANPEQRIDRAWTLPRWACLARWD